MNTELSITPRGKFIMHLLEFCDLYEDTEFKKTPYMNGITVNKDLFKGIFVFLLRSLAVFINYLILNYLRLNYLIFIYAHF